VAVLRALQLGDFLCAVPALRALRRALPAAHITLVGLPWAAGLVERFPKYLDGFLALPGFPGLPEHPFDAKAFPDFLATARELRFDLAIQMHGSGNIVNELLLLLGAPLNAGFYAPGSFRPDDGLFTPWPEEGSERRRLLALAEFLGAPASDDSLEFPLTEEDRRMAEALREDHLIPDGYACVHPGAQLASRRWPIERFAAVADALAAEGVPIVITGSQSEREMARALRRAMKAPAVNLAGQTTLGSLGALLEKARLLVSNDTGLSHIADALKVPSVVVANGSDVDRWRPRDRSLHRVLFHPVECRPCAHPVCPIGHPCALGVPVDGVVRQAFSLLQAPAPCPA
jgi:ADP-heptose:LPS heptosyltransferase